MPSVLKYVPPTETSRVAFASDVQRERNNRYKAYRKALDYYKGNHDLALEVDSGEVDDNTTINLVKMTADRTTSFLFPVVPEVKLDLDSIEQTEDEKWLQGFFEENGGLAALTKLGLRGFLSGHNFVRVTPQTNSSKKYPKLTILDPTSVSVYWKADDVADVVWYEMRYNVGDEIFIKDFVWENTQWLIYTYKSLSKDTVTSLASVNTHHGQTDPNGKAWDANHFGTNFELISREVHNINVPPIIEWPHLPNPDGYYGMYEADQKMLQDMINRLSSLRNKIARENANPVDVLTGASPDDIDAEGDLISIGQVGATITRLEMKGDMKAVTETLDKMIETYLSVARVVLLKGEAKDLQRVTNASVRTLFLDMLSKNDIIRSSYGFAIKQVARTALLIGYKLGVIESNYQEADIDVRLPDPLPIDMKELADVLGISIHGGWMSKQTAAGLMELDWIAEKTAMAEEREEALENMMAVQALTQSENSGSMDNNDNSQGNTNAQNSSANESTRSTETENTE